MAVLADARPATVEPDPVEVAEIVPVRTGRTRAWRTLRRNPVFWLGAVLAGGMLLSAALAPRDAVDGWGQAWDKVLLGWMGVENLEQRTAAAGWIDPVVLRILRSAPDPAR